MCASSRDHGRHFGCVVFPSRTVFDPCPDGVPLGDVMNKKKEFDLFDRPKTRRVLWWLLWGTCAATVLMEFFAKPEPHFPHSGFISFNALFGLISCVVLILVAKVLGFVLKKPTDYYDD
jgi:hypothetical protein